MAVKTLIGNGEIAAADFKAIKWAGTTKGGNPVVINLKNGINMGNIEWTMAEKNDIVPAITFTACYENTDTASNSNIEPWSIEYDDDTTAGASEIILGAGVFYIGGTAVALTRGGGSFTVEREYREINADGDRGAVKGRIVMESSRATLTMNVLTMLTKLSDIYTSIEVSA